MNHTEAVEKKLTESYLLGALTEEECAAFEEHYFTCAQCAEDIKTAAALVANVKHVLKEEPSLSAAAERVPSRAGWFSWWRPAYSFAAAAAVMAILLYQNVVTIPHLKSSLASSTAPRAMAHYSFIPQGGRGADSLIIPYQPEPLAFYVDITTKPYAKDDFASFTYIIQTESGKMVLPEVPVSAELAKNTVPVLIPGAKLQPGRYALIVRGTRKDHPESIEIANYPFVVESNNEGIKKQ